MRRLDEQAGQWQVALDELQAELRDWRAAHLRATLTEIEAALDARLDAVRARLLEDLALASAATEGRETAGEEPRACPDCGGPLLRRGRHLREVTTTGDHRVRLERQYCECRACETRLFPPR